MRWEYELVELRQLVYFEAVVRHGGFTRAAEQLHVAQPAVSAQIKRLEAELGTPLIRRTTRRSSLTHAGELFLVRTRAVLAQLDAARADLDGLAAVLHGRVRIGATQVLGSLDLPATMAAFRNRYPGVALALHAGLLDELLHDLDAADIDLVVGPLHEDLPKRYRALPLVTESLVLITPPGHRLSATPPPGSLAAARDEEFISLPAGSGLRSILLSAAAAEGFVPRIEFETSSPMSIRELVAAGLGVALIAASAVRGPGPAVQVCPLLRAPRHPAIGVIVAARRLPSAAQAFYDFLRAIPDDASR
jgi:LysR family transcriptional activator of glutamate synthase operon